MESRDRTSTSVDGRYRTLLILWFAMLNSIVLFFVLTLFINRPEVLDENPVLTWAVAGAGALLAIISLIPKKKFLERAAEQQEPNLVQTGYVIAFTLTEVPSLLGLLLFFISGERYYYVMFVISVLFMLLHFPRREDVLAATYKGRST